MRDDTFFDDVGNSLVVEHLSINYDLLYIAQTRFGKFGFTPVNVPWRVPIDIQRETTDYEFGEYNDINYEELIGSAEQSFLYLDNLGKLPKGKFQATTPCFRDEPKLDKFHLPYFMKLELYINDDSLMNEDYVKELTNMVGFNYLNFMEMYFPKKMPAIKQIKTNIGFDIEIDGVEVGSYGLRHSKKLGRTWVYGTGLALPRFTIQAGITNE